MSNIYILEPPTSGKVLLKTSVGDIDIELWTKEAPKACRNFIQLCLEGYYNGTIFHRVVKGFIVQGGDPNGDGTGGESIYGEPFKDEFHQRLKFVRRGLVAMANAGCDDNGSQFFFTLAAATELQNKHTIFGKVTGDTLFNMLKLAEGLIEDERPTYPHKIISTDVLNNPFQDIVLRIKEVKIIEKIKKPKVAAVKNFKLLSFGAEAEEDEEEAKIESKKFSGKSKSTHDVLGDPKLSSDATHIVQVKKEAEDEGEEVDHEVQLESIRKKLKTDTKKTAARSFYYDEYEEEQQENERKKRKENILKEIKDVKREYHKNKLQKEKERVVEQQEEMEKNEVTEEYKKECEKFKETSNSFPRKGPGREQFTLNLLSKFKNKLESAKEKNPEDEDEPVQHAEVNEDEQWMTHKLHFQDGEPILAKDANTKGDDWFEIYDPRNPLNKRRRGESTATTK